AADITWARRAWERPQLDLVKELLDRQRPGPGAEDLRGFEWYYLHRLAQAHRGGLPVKSSPVRALACSSDGTILAVGSDNGEVTLWDPATRRELGVLRGHSKAVHALAFAADGPILASASHDPFLHKGAIKVWDVRAQKERITIPYVAGGVALSPDGK